MDNRNASNIEPDSEPATLLAVGVAVCEQLQTVQVDDKLIPPLGLLASSWIV